MEVMAARLGMGLIMWYDISEAMRREFAVRRLREMLHGHDIPIPLTWETPRAADTARRKQGSAFKRPARRGGGLDLDAEVLPILLQQTDFGTAPIRVMQRPNSRTDMSRLRALKILRTTSSGRILVREQGPATGSKGQPTTAGSGEGGSGGDSVAHGDDLGDALDDNLDGPALARVATGLSRMTNVEGSMCSADDAFMEAVWNEHTGTHQETSGAGAIRHGATRFKQARVKARRSWFNHLHREAVRPVTGGATGRLDRLVEGGSPGARDDVEEAWPVHSDADLGVDTSRRPSVAPGSVGSASSSRKGTPDVDEWGGSGRSSPTIIGGDFAKLPVFVRMCWRTVLRETSAK